MKNTAKIKIIFGLLYISIISVFLWLFFSSFTLEEIGSYNFIKDNSKYLIDLKNTNLFLSSLFFLLLILIWIFLLGFGSPIILFSGFIFGKWYGSFLAIFGLSLGATFFYIFANYFFKDLIKNKLSQRLNKLNINFKKNEFIYMLIYRFIGGIPFFISNLLPVILNVRSRIFFLASAIGMTPQIFIGASLGSGIENIISTKSEAPSILEIILDKNIYLPISGFILIIILSLLIKKFLIKN